MLQKRIHSTIDLIEDVIDNRQKENDNANVAKRNNTFFENFKKLTPFVTSYILIKKNFGFTLQSSTASDLQDLMNYSKNTFENARAVNPASFCKKAETFADSISKEWETFYKSSNNEIVGGLNIIVLVHPTPNIVRSCISAFNKCEKLPLTQESIDSYNVARQKADELLKEMKLDDEIRDFLIKVRDRKATLADITPSIMEWIQSENIADKVSLSIRNIM